MWDPIAKSHSGFLENFQSWKKNCEIKGSNFVYIFAIFLFHMFFWCQLSKWSAKSFYTFCIQSLFTFYIKGLFTFFIKSLSTFCFRNLFTFCIKSLFTFCSKVCLPFTSKPYLHFTSKDQLLKVCLLCKVHSVKSLFTFQSRNQGFVFIYEVTL